MLYNDYLGACEITDSKIQFIVRKDWPQIQILDLGKFM